MSQSVSPLPTRASSESNAPQSNVAAGLASPSPADIRVTPPVRLGSAPPSTFQSPKRHHHREVSSHRPVKETLNAHSEYSNSEDDGSAQHRINQYMIKQEIGRGSFGSVHLAVDQFGQEYAIKEFSKSRLRKRAQSNLLRRSQARRANRQIGAERNAPSQRPPASNSPSENSLTNNSLDLIKEEIAIMKKLNHPNLVSLIEVLDDPDEDSLYMVLEMCKKGVVMKVGLEDNADPYAEEQARCWFRDMILGIEYLHAQGVVHRDLKPDNCLVTGDDVLKIVDFGVSEMFAKESDMNTDKSVGSPAFMPPELCVAKHGHVSGRAVDIWSMGVTLYCLQFGKIPFHKDGIFDLFESIRNDAFDIHGREGTDFADLMSRLLEKDPQKRIKMEELREHPWVTRNGEDPLLSREENVAHVIETTDEEVNAAITGNMGHLLVVMRAVKKFKTLLVRRRPDLMEGIFGRASSFVAPPRDIHSPPLLSRRAKSHEGASAESPIESLSRPPKDGSVRPYMSAGLSHLSQKASEFLSRDAAAVVDPKSGQTVLLEPDPHKKRHLLGRVVRSSHAPNQISAVSSTAASIPGDSIASVPSPAATAPVTPVPASRSVSKSPFEGGGHRGHAHDPLEDTIFLNIGAGLSSEDLSGGEGVSLEPEGLTPSDADPSASSTLSSNEQDLSAATSSPRSSQSHPVPTGVPIVCESPSAVDENVYESAYKQEVDRILESKGRRATIYLTRRVDKSISKIRRHVTEAGAAVSERRHNGTKDGSEEPSSTAAESTQGDRFASLAKSTKSGAKMGLARLAEEVQKGVKT